jgi:hypothetical protein
LWVTAGLLVLLLAITTYALAAPPEESYPFTQDAAVGTAAATVWRSGWLPIGQGEDLVLNHNLGVSPDDLAVEVWFNDIDDGWGINRRYYGGVESNNQYLGAYWKHLTDTSVTVHREADDTAADQVLVTVWVTVHGATDFLSPWTDIDRALAPADGLIINHNRNVPADQLMASVWFSGTTESGGTPNIHQRGYGSKESAGSWVGAAWVSLTNNTIKVRRAADDDYVEQVRVAVVQPPTPDWQHLTTVGELDPNVPLVLNHNLNWEPTMLLVRAECFRPASLPLFGVFGIHQALAGGNDNDNGAPFIGWQGAAVQNLTPNQVTLYRFVDDTLCPQMRVRIWRRSAQNFLPIITRD